MRRLRHAAGFRDGFSMVEVLVALAIVAILSAVVVPQIVGRLRESRESALSQTFFGLSQGVAEYKKAVTRYPSNLTLLTTAPASGATDACGDTLSTANRNNWRGPYVSRQLLATGLPMGDAQIQDVLERVAGPPTYLYIVATGVDTKIADGLEAELDGVTGAPTTTGTIRTVVETPTQVTVKYSIPISGC